MAKKENLNKLGVQSRRSFLQTSGSALSLTLASGLSAPAIAAEKKIRIGFVSPQTGPLAAFGESDAFVIADIEKAIAGGIEVNGKKYEVEILSRDSQSNPNRTAEVTSDLILREEVNILLGSSTGDTTNPVADQAEVNEVPCVTTDTPWEAHFFGRGGNPAEGFDWTYHFFWGLADMLGVFTDMWNSKNTNKSVGAFFTNDVEGVALSNEELGFPKFIRDAGYKLELPGLATPFSDDYTSFVSDFKSAEIDILTGAVTPPDFATFWAQSAQQGLRKKLKFCTIAKAMLFPAAVESLGDAGHGITTEVWWSPSHPFSSGLTGQSAAQLAAAYTASTGRQWTQPIGFKHAVLEVAIDALKRSGDPHDLEKVRDAIAATDYQSIVGPVKWSGGGPANPVRNVSTTPLVGGQWKLGKGDFKYDLQIVNNQRASAIPTNGELELLS